MKNDFRPALPSSVPPPGTGRQRGAPPVAGSSDAPGVPGVPGVLVTAAVLAVSSLTILANATISPSLPGIAAHFAGTPGIEGLAGLALSLPSLSIMLSAGFFGWLCDRVDPLRILAASMIAYALAGASGALAPTMQTLLVGRFLLGFGVAGTMTVATLLASSLWNGEARARFMGRQFAATALFGVFLLVGGGLLAELDWRAPFLIYLIALPIAAAVWFPLRRALPHARTRARGGASGPFPWSAFALPGALACFTMIVFYLIPTRLPFHLASIGIPAPSAAGMAIAAVTFAGIPGALFFGRIRARFEPPVIGAASFVVIAAGFVVISFAATLPGIVVGTFCVGLGLGPSFPNFMSWLMERMPDGAKGRASGLFTVMVFGGQFLSPLLGQAVSAQVGLVRTFDVFAGLLIVVAVALLMRGNRAGDADRRSGG